VGFATNILNRNPVDLIDACLLSLEGKKFEEPLPWWKGFNGIVQNIEGTNSYLISGSYNVANTTTVEITELPPSMTYQKFEALLNSLQEKGHIQYYDDNCTKNEIKYIVKFQRAILAEKIKKEILENMFKINESETENLTCLDERGKLIIFKNVTDLIQHFVKFRLSFYDKRKEFILSDLQKQSNILDNRAKFIKLIVDKKIQINNIPKNEIVESIEKHKIDKKDGSFDYLLSMPIYSLTKEKYEEIQKQLELILSEIEKTKKIKPIDMYKNDLKELRKKLVK
jgi:DNA topoisomerase-2